MQNTIIEMSNVSFSYEDKPILSHFSTQIERGSFVCVVGESGSGKSTLLRLMNGLLEPEEGTIKINNTLLSKENCIEMRRKMGYVLQENSLFPHFTIYQNMCYCLQIQQKTRQYSKQRIAELLPLVNLQSDLLDKFPDELSGGQKQRVGIVRAIAHQPEIVLMDEPFSALDSETRAMLQDLVKDIHKELQTTFVMVTHSQNEAQKLGTYILEMKTQK